MRIAGVAMVGNEADVVEAFVRHNLQFLDRLVVIAHRPVDGTAEILAALAAEGLPLEIRAPRFHGFQQGAEITAAAKQCFAEGCDFVLPLDADEFLKLPRPDYLRAALPAIPADRFACSRWQNYAPARIEDCGHANPLVGLTHRRVDEPTPIFKVILTRRFAEAPYHLIEGSHCVMANGESQPMVELKAIRLAHFPLRSPAQAAHKVRQALAAKAGEKVRSATAAHWFRLADLLADGRLPDVPLLASLALSYPDLETAPLPCVADPLPTRLEIRYPPGMGGRRG